MNGNQKEQIVNTVKSEMETWLLEQKIHNLEQTLSDTISFFSASITMAGVILAVVLVIVGWIMKKVFDNKLMEVQKYALNTSNKFDDILELDNKINSKYKEINEVDEYFKRSKKEWESIKEINDYQSKEIEYLKEQVESDRTITKLNLLVPKIDKLLEEISEDDVEQYDWGDDIDGTAEEYKAQKSYYSGRREVFEHFNKTNYEFIDYLSDIDAGENGDRLDELKDTLEAIEEFYDLFLSVKIN